MLLVAVMAKLGTYGIVRFDLNLFPQASRTLAPLLLTLAVIGILYGAVVACAQRDLKRLLAYSSLAQIGFIVLGTFALNSQGLTGGVLQMVNHGLIIATLFILVGWIYERRGTWQCLAAGPAGPGAGAGRRLHRGHAGLDRRARTQRLRRRVPDPGRHVPGPPLVGGGRGHRRHRGRRLPPVGLPAGLPRPTRPRPTPRPVDLAWRERLVMAPLIVLIVFLGVFPKPVLDRITPSVDQLIVHVDQVTDTPVPASLDPHLAAAHAPVRRCGRRPGPGTSSGGGDALVPGGRRDRRRLLAASRSASTRHPHPPHRLPEHPARCSS